MSKSITYLVKGIFLWFVLGALLAGCAAPSPAAPAPDSAEPEPTTLRVTCPPNPNALPLFVVMEQYADELDIAFVPVPGVAELAAAVQGDQADVALFFSAAGAKQYSKGSLTQIHLWNVNVWRALYLVSGPEINGLDDLAGKKILASFQGGAPDLVMRAAMKQAGYDPDADFTIEYLPSAQVKQLLLAGEGDAALLPEPQVTLLIQKAASQGIDLQVAVDLQTGMEMDAWQAGYAPLGGVFVTDETLNDPARRAAFDRFVEAYAEASGWVMDHPDETGEIVAQAFDEYFGSQVSPGGVAEAITSGKLVFESRPVDDLRPALDQFLEMITGTAPDESFYAAP